MNLRWLLVTLFFVFMPAAASFPGRAYYSLTKLHELVDASGGWTLIVPSIPLCGAILLLSLGDRPPSSYGRRSLRWSAAAVQNRLSFSLPLMLWFLAALLSVLANGAGPDTIRSFIAIFVAGVFAYLAAARTECDFISIQKYVVAFGVGSLLPLLHGLYLYYLEWGIPNAETLIFSRYNLERMQSYGDATFGNVGNTAAFLMLLYPPLLAMALERTSKLFHKPIIGTVLFLTCLHFLIVQVRAAFIVGFVVTIISLIFYRFRRFRHLAVLTALGLTIAYPMADAGTLFIERMQSAALVDRVGDSSVDLRLDAIRVGWGIFLDNWAFGVGPGSSRYHNIYDTAHQFNVQQASELGVLGFLASIILVAFVILRLIAVLREGSDSPENRARFIALIGPAAYLLYGVLANMVLALGVVNSWIVLFVYLLTLSERIPRSRRL